MYNKVLLVNKIVCSINDGVLSESERKRWSRDCPAILSSVFLFAFVFASLLIQAKNVSNDIGD